MIIVKLQGGLGNQMFQYAIGKILAKKEKTQLYFDCSFFEDQLKRPGFTPRQYELEIFNPFYQIATEETINSFSKSSNCKRICKFLKIPYKKIYREAVCKFDLSILKLKAPLYLDGYFQSEKYYSGNEQFVRSLFQFQNFDSKEHVELIQSIASSSAVSVHFRRGDYVSDDVTAGFHGICSIEYYRQAFQMMIKKIETPHFYIFSDDLKWVEKQVVGWAPNITFVTGNDGANSWKDMMLMSKCNHHIIANSSFSWWGAWLNDKPGKNVIAPLRWFNDHSINTIDLVPKTWTRI